MKQEIVLLVILAFIFMVSEIHAGCSIINNNCVSGEMKVLEKTKGFVPVSQLAQGDVIRGVMRSRETYAWCKVDAVFQVAQGQNRTTYNGFTADHMVVDRTVHRYGRKGLKKREQVYTLSTDCDATLNSAGQLFTPISTTFCRHDLSWGEYLSLISAIRRVTVHTGYFWYDLNAYHDNATASVPRWADQLPILCDELLRCARQKECQTFEVVTERFVHEHLNANFAQIVDKVFPNLGGNVTKSEKGTVSKVVHG